MAHPTGDDAAVYRLSADRALVVTADFFTPIVDDPHDYGRIAAANALSDIYAMGARPLFALNLVAFPRALLGEGILEKILSGGSATATLAGIPVVGGHSIDDAEPKYGLVAVGEAHPDRLVTNAGARPGDSLVITKPIGSGIIATAIKKGSAPSSVVESAVTSMCALNEQAADTMRSLGIRAATDVTGYGFLGHLRAMLHASGCSADVSADAVPLLPGARRLLQAGHVPGGTKRNLADIAGDADYAPSVEDDMRLLLADAQTSGGLLMCVPTGAVERCLAMLAQPVPGTLAAVVGRVREGPPGRIRVR